MITATMITIPGLQETWVWSNDASGPAFSKMPGWVVVSTVKTEAKGDISISEAGEVLQKKWCCPPPAIHVFERICTHDCHFLNNCFCFQLIETSWIPLTSPFNIPNACVDFSEVPFRDASWLRFAHDDREMLAITSEEGDVSWYAIRPSRKPLVLSEHVFKLSVLRSWSCVCFFC